MTAWALQRRRLGTDRRMVVVDAGSGSTRCVCLGTRRWDGAVRVVGGPERVPRRLGDALLADDVDAWARPSLTHNGEPWRVCCRFLRDAKVHNECGDERDYVEEEEVCFRRPYFMNRLRE